MSKSRLDDSLIDLNRSPSHLLHRVLQMALDLFVEEAGPGLLRPPALIARRLPIWWRG